MTEQRPKAMRKTVHQLLEALHKHEQTLAELMVDAQDLAEEAGIFSPGFFTGDNDDQPICVPEDADELIDGARTQVQEAIEQLEEWQKRHGTFDPAEDIEYLRVAPQCEHCDGTGEDTSHTYPDGAHPNCEHCDGYGYINPEDKS